MNVRSLIPCAVVCLLASVAGGCGSPSVETGRNKNPAIVMELDPKVSQAIATVRVGDEVKFVLPASRGPEFVWQIVTHDPRSLRLSSEFIFKPGAAGAAGTSTVAFIAQRPSRGFLRFAYVPAAGGKETELVEAYQILVTVRP